MQPQLVDGAGRRRAVLEFHAPAQAGDLVVIDDSFDLGVIALQHAGTRMHQPVGQGAVVREQQQPLGVIVEPADGIEPPSDVADEIHHRRAPLRIVQRGDEAGGLVEHEIDRGRLKPEQFAVDFDVIALRVGLGAQLGDNPAVDGDAAVRDQRFRLAARRDPRLGNEFLKSDLHIKGTGYFFNR